VSLSCGVDIKDWSPRKDSRIFPHIEQADLGYERRSALHSRS